MGRVLTRVISHHKSKNYASLYLNMNLYLSWWLLEPGNLINECFYNVDTYIEKHGGQKIHGLNIWQRANVLIEAEAHAVWESPSGNMVDVTLHSNNETSTLFLVDHHMIYEGNCIPNIRRALTSSPLVVEFIALYNERDQIASATEGNTYSLPADIDQTDVGNRGSI